jgi:hypothetical protein
MLRNLFDNFYIFNSFYLKIYIKLWNLKSKHIISNVTLKCNKIFVFNKFYKIKRYKLFFNPKFQYTNKILWYNKFFFFKIWKKKKYKLFTFKKQWALNQFFSLRPLNIYTQRGLNYSVKPIWSKKIIKTN